MFAATHFSLNDSLPGAFLNADGALPHHFDGTFPTYTSLTGMVQTGPNIFWVLSCLNYAKLSGDAGWLRAYMPVNQLSSPTMALNGVGDAAISCARRRDPHSRVGPWVRAVKHRQSRNRNPTPPPCVLGAMIACGALGACGEEHDPSSLKRRACVSLAGA